MDFTINAYSRLLVGDWGTSLNNSITLEFLQKRRKGQRSEVRGPISEGEEVK